MDSFYLASPSIARRLHASACWSLAVLSMETPLSSHMPVGCTVLDCWYLSQATQRSACTSPSLFALSLRIPSPCRSINDEWNWGAILRSWQPSLHAESLHDDTGCSSSQLRLALILGHGSTEAECNQIKGIHPSRLPCSFVSQLPHSNLPPASGLDHRKAIASQCGCAGTSVAPTER